MIQEKLKDLRKQKGISQEKMAKILGTDTSNYSRKERGEVKIFDDEWEKLAKTLEVPLEDIKGDETKFSFQYENSTLHDQSGSNIHYYNVPDFFLEIQKKYIEKLEKENTKLLDEIAALKSQK
ncbi:helix-turn-helix transcriptional regulator [Chryseobacterium populi]|uniref:Putative transcriptional regulator n=1 Tax=Chryseobacterium populi TaxID=1144316 RepID=J3CH27_9FLAO|nr:helix-turn-helix transcriptional regulator [Chryseobacterium populi]EJL71246.1 putative transcriptional regulator [Chryseobacterium populi]